MLQRPASDADAQVGPVASTSEADESDEPSPEQPADNADNGLESLGPGPDFAMYDLAIFGPGAAP